MKKIEAFIQPHMLTKVIDSLEAIEGLPGVGVSEIRGFGRAQAESANEKVAEEFIEHVKRCKLELVVGDELAEQVLEAITRSAHTGHPGDGLIIVSTVNEVVRIRTGERSH